MEDSKKQKILKLDEVYTYFLIDQCGAFIWRMNHEMSHGRIPEVHHHEVEKDIVNTRELQQFAVDNLTRFGVDPESAKDRQNGNYWKWYKHWDNWKKGLTVEEWRKVDSLITNEESLDEYLPEKSWRD